MLKVNESLLLEDYKKLVEKKAVSEERIKNAAKQFAVNRGYNAEQIAGFIAYVLTVEGGGLSKEEEIKLALFGEYVCEVEDAEVVKVAEDIAEKEVGEVPEKGFDAEISEVADNGETVI